jgi:leucyl-tRNA synthetase
MALRRLSHKAIAGVSDDIERFHFNRAVARIYELANAVQEHTATRGAAAEDGPALREALETLTLLIGPMMPHLGEELWQALGHKTLLADAVWPTADPALIEDATVTVAVQVSGKLRATIEIARDLDQAAIEAAALGNDNVQRAIAGRPVRKLIVVPNRIVNVVV